MRNFRARMVMLCNDCLAILPYKDAIHCNLEPCPICGKYNVCGCQSCEQDAIKELLRRYKDEKK